jgi:hypothetical protein
MAFNAGLAYRIKMEGKNLQKELLTSLSTCRGFEDQ